uniref:Reverse transcriptase domain-containing protein n=1 Tax=Oryzias melastigma TaxID=30732 RepID=A0A3B3DJ96_ORYME
MLSNTSGFTKLDRGSTRTVRSCAFDTLQPHLIGHKLLQMDVNPHLILWVLSFLTARPQRVTVNDHLSSAKSISTGAPQGSVISPLLFTLFTIDCRNSTPGITCIKYSDNTVIMDTTNTDVLQQELDTFSSWCKNNCLDLNVSKTKEMTLCFHHGQSNMQSLGCVSVVVWGRSLQHKFFLGVGVTSY